MNQDYLRNSVQELKRNYCISYCYLATKLKMKRHSFYNFMNSQKNLSPKRENELKLIVERLINNGI